MHPAPQYSGTRTHITTILLRPLHDLQIPVTRFHRFVSSIDSRTTRSRSAISSLIFLGMHNDTNLILCCQHRKNPCTAVAGRGYMIDLLRHNSCYETTILANLRRPIWTIYSPGVYNSRLVSETFSPFSLTPPPSMARRPSPLDLVRPASAMAFANNTPPSARL